MASTIVTEGPVTHVSVPAGETSPSIYMGPGDAAVVLIPGNTGSMLAEASWSMVRELQAGAGEWQPWDAGTVTAKTTQLLWNATAVRFTATTAPGVAEIHK